MKGLAAGLLIFFVFLGLMSSQCLCDLRPAPVWDWVTGSPQTVRCYPVYTPFEADPNDASEAAFVVKFYTRATVGTHTFSEFSSLMATLPGTMNESTVQYIRTNVYGGWSSGLGHWEIWNRSEVGEVQWDFTPLPVDATVLTSTLHAGIESQDGVLDYYPFAFTFGTAELLGADHDVFDVQDVDAGDQWIGGSHPWIQFWNEGCTTPSLVCGQTHDEGVYRESLSFFFLGWGNFSEGECTYMDVTYTIPEWQCVENCP